MLDSLPGIFYLFDHTGRFLRWNHTFETVSGYSAEEIAAMGPLDFFAGADRTLIEERTRKVFETGNADAEASLLSKDGRQTPHYFIGVRIVLDGVPCCIGTGIDVTAQRHLEAQLRQAQKIEAIGQLAGGVAHDFNNILGVIMGYGEMAQRQLGADHPVRARVDQMMKAAERAAGLTRQLLAFSRKQILQPRLLDLNAVVADTQEMLGRLIGEDVDLVLHAAPGLGTVKADPGQIEQVILNLAVNARDAMPQGGSLTLETANVDLDERLRRGPPDHPAGALRDAGGLRHGHGHGPGDAAAALRALLHDQARGPGDGAGPGHGLRDREAERRQHLGLQRAGPGHDVQGVPAPCRRAGRGRSTGSPAALRRKRLAVTRRSCSWRTPRRCET